VTVTLNLKPEVEASLLAQAEASGMSLDEYLLFVVEEAATPKQRSATGKFAREEAVANA
jgi:hypothetical protein